MHVISMIWVRIVNHVQEIIFRKRVDPGYGKIISIIGTEAPWLLACITCTVRNKKN